MKATNQVIFCLQLAFFDTNTNFHNNSRAPRALVHIHPSIFANWTSIM